MHYEQHGAHSGPNGYESDRVPSLFAIFVHPVQTKQPALILKHQCRQFE